MIHWMRTDGHLHKHDVYTLEHALEKMDYEYVVYFCPTKYIHAEFPITTVVGQEIPRTCSQQRMKENRTWGDIDQIFLMCSHKIQTYPR
jgi:hypothetical protein